MRFFAQYLMGRFAQDLNQVHVLVKYASTDVPPSIASSHQLRHWNMCRPTWPDPHLIQGHLLATKKMEWVRRIDWTTFQSVRDRPLRSDRATDSRGCTAARRRTGYHFFRRTGCIRPDLERRGNVLMRFFYSISCE